MIPWRGLPVHYCAHGHPIILPTLIVRMGDKVYCAEHVPQPEPSEPLPEPPAWKMSARDISRVGFQKWRYQKGAMKGDDYPEPLSDDDKERLAKHIVP